MKEKILDRDIPGIVRKALQREAVLLHRVIKALRKEIQNKKKEAR